MENSTTPQDDAAMSPASTGSVEPVAYQAVDEYGRPFGYAQIILPFGKWPKSQRVALYLQPQPALTDAERFVLNEVMDAYADNDDDIACGQIAAVISDLLERTK